MHASEIVVPQLGAAACYLGMSLAPSFVQVMENEVEYERMATIEQL